MENSRDRLTRAAKVALGRPELRGEDSKTMSVLSSTKKETMNSRPASEGTGESIAARHLATRCRRG